VIDGSLIVFQGDRGLARQVGANWDPSRRAWTAQATRQNAIQLADGDPSLTNLRDALVTSWTPVDDARLYAYQRDVAGRLAGSARGAIVVMSPGLGKTAVAVVAADELVDVREKIVVVAPASLLRTWEREIRLWQRAQGDVYIIDGAIDELKAARARWIVTSWDRAARITADEWGKGWPLVILDESVLTKSRTSKRFKAMQRLRGATDRFWLLSGNPTTKYADDLWTQLHLIWPAAFRSYWRFAERYCYIEDSPWGKKITGTRKDRDAMAENSDLVIVVNQEEVLELPEYLFEVIDVDLTRKQAREYAKMEALFVATLYGQDVIAANEIARLQKLQQITSWWDGESGKHDTLVDIIRQYEPPYLIWTHWRDGAGQLLARLMAAGLSNTRLVTGELSKRERDRMLEEFKAGDYDALILSIGVGKFGHTFTNVKTIFYIDKTWNADDYFQSLHRVRRIGLKHRPVVVTLRAPGTVDELVEDNLTGKLGGISRLTKSNLRDLLKGLGK
jgi:superfamily II DNA or RNA helicase